MNREYILWKIESLSLINQDEMTRPEVKERNSALIQFYKNKLRDEE